MQFHSFFDYHSVSQPDAEFASDGERQLTYGEALTQVNRFANALVASGLSPGDRFAYLGKNSIEYLLLYYAASKSGAVPVPLNYRLAPPEWEYILNDSESKLIIADEEYCDAVDSIRPNLPQVSESISIGGTAKDGWTNFDTWIDSQPTTPPTVNSGSDDVLQMYTSGTTGRPKGAVLTHRNINTNIIQFTGIYRDQWNGRALLVAPLYHIAAAFSGWGTVFLGNSVYIQREFIPADTVQALSEGGISSAVLVPAMIQACLAMVPDVAERSYDDLQTLSYGASAIAETTLRRAMEVFGCDFIQGYGMTEASPIISSLSADEHKRAIEKDPHLLLSAGRAIIGTEIKIVDADDNELPLGEMGEIIVRGDQVMKGYWRMPEATEETLRGGWLHTGDAGSMDEEGFVFIQDRVKDMIVSGGENIYPREVEEVLFQHPAIVDAAVIGVPDEKWGETVKAILVIQGDETPSEEDIVEFCRTKLGGYKVPRSVDYIEELPRNPSGKVLKRELREQYWEDQDRRVAGS